MWFSHLEGKYAVFVVQCWSGDLHKKSKYHYFLTKIRLVDTTINVDEADRALVFVKHIENHLTEEQKVLCKICDKTIDEIYEEDADK